MSSSSPSNARTLLFIVVLSFVCALVLSILATALKTPQELAQEFDRSKQMMIAARILHPDGYFQIEDKEGAFGYAKVVENGGLVPSETPQYPSREEALLVYKKRFNSRLVAPDGQLTTFQEAGIDKSRYLSEYKKAGYYKQPYKLIYEILPNPSKEGGAEAPIGYVVPVNGFGLWDAIYGYLAIKPDGNTVIGISWYEQKETPGLGANITEASWQKQFYGKKIFQASPDGSIDYKSSPLGLIVVRGKVENVYGERPRAKSAVDGMTGATLTGNGVTEAYKSVLSAYRPFFIGLHQEEAEDGRS